ncbi:hypothetical protein V5O48_014655 [Marasmius crinis-equi]|uniref:Ribonuclease H1 N-terminal domain-containing protein n=1 Tax=Marasmius crinis-equi TaxID=585013 RepID=A0ABR3EWQ3_9AGAR
MTSSLSSSASSHPKTPTKSRTVTKSRSEVVEERTPDKGTPVVSRSVTYTRTEVVTETPRRNHCAHRRGRRSPGQTTNLSSDSDDSDDTASPLSNLDESDPFSPARSESSTTSGLSSSISSTSSLNPSATPASRPEEPIPRAESDETIQAYYQTRYPGKVPHPNSFRSLPVNQGDYYVVSGGKSVGIFTNWNYAAEFVLGVRKNKYKHYTTSWQAWLGYRSEWETKQIRVLGQYQDTAPLETQIEDMALGEPAA